MIKGFSHVQLVVSDVDVSSAWYGVALGMEQFARGTYAGGEYAGLRSPTGQFVIGLQTGLADGTVGAANAMIDHLSFAVEDHDDLIRHRQAILAAGIDAGDPFEEAASWNVRFHDPDGLVVEITAAKRS